MPRHHLPQLIHSRIKHLLARLERQCWQEQRPLTVEGGPLQATIVSIAEGSQGPWQEVARHSYFGPEGGDWATRWHRIRIPKARAGEAGRRFLRWDCNGETTVYHKGQAWAGLDVAHTSCPLPDSSTTLHLETGLWQTAIWHPGRPIQGPGCRFDGAWLALRNEAAWEAFHHLDVLLMLLESQLTAAGWSETTIERRFTVPERMPRLLRILLSELDAAADVYERDGLPAFSEACSALMARLPAEDHQGIAALTGHAHLDLVWHWPEAVTRRKMVHTSATLLRLMERYPEFRFSGSQPYLYRALEADEPTLARAVLDKVRTGQWELTGGMEVESDTLIPCGEALARALRYGQEEFTRLRGSPSRVVWIPDVFGYAACLPQLMVAAGIEGFFTTKLTWSAVNKFPHSSFHWQGHDGSTVLTHLCPTGYNGGVHLHENIPAMEEYAQAGVHNEVLLPTGYGDGAGGPTERMCERARRLANLAGAPKHQWVTIEPFFERLRAVAERLPRYQGELYLEYHRGTLTSQSEFKRAYRRLERSLQQHEAVRAMLGGSALAATDWQRLLFSQFHDALPGSSIGLVYEQLTPELEQASDQHQAHAARLLAQGSKRKGHLVANTLPLARCLSAAIPLSQLPADCQALSTPDGLLIPLQRSGDQALLRLHSQALASQRLLPASQPVPAVPIAASPRHLDNGILRAEFDPQGQLCALRIDGRDMALRPGCGFATYPDTPARYDAWDIDQYTMDLPTPLPPCPLQVIEQGPVRSVLRGSCSFGRGSTITVEWILESGSDNLEIIAHIDWQEEHTLLKWLLTTDYQGSHARFGAPFGSLRRRQHAGLSIHEAQWEVPASRWAAISDDNEDDGMAILTEAKYGFHAREGELGLSLLRSPRYPDPQADIGQHRLRFALTSHRRHSQGHRLNTAAAADALDMPGLVVRGGALQPPPLAWEDLGSLVPAWACPDPDIPGALLLRLHESMGARGHATLTAPGHHHAELVDLLGRVQVDLERAEDHRWQIAYGPYQMLSLRLRVGE